MGFAVLAIADSLQILPGQCTTCRYSGRSVIPAWQLPQHPRGPAVWQVETHVELKEAVELLLAEPLHRRSQGHATLQAVAKVGNGMLTIAWEVFVIMVLEPALAKMEPRGVVLMPRDNSAIHTAVDNAANAATS